MGLFRSIFGGEKSMNSVISESQTKIFRIHGIANPSDPQKHKVLFYTCISTTAILNDLTGVKAAQIINKLVDETAKLAYPLQVRVSEIGSSAEESRLILANFPKELGIDLHTRLGGNAAFDALYNALGRTALNEFMRSGKNASMGVSGYAAAVLLDRCFSSHNHFLEVAHELLEVTAKIAESAYD